MTKAGQSPSTSATLLIQLRNAGDVAAWRTFVDLYTGLVFGYARKRGLQDADAQDVVQQVFTQVSQSIRSFEYDPKRGRFRGWLGTVASQTIGRHLRKAALPGQGVGSVAQEQMIESLPGPAEPQWIEEFNRHVCRVALERIRHEFDPLAWQAFELTWVHNQEPQEAAAALLKPATWVYKAKFKILQRLKDEIEFLTADTAYFQ